MRSRTFLLTLLLAAGIFVVPAAVHAAIPFFGPILPDQTCPAAWGMVMIVVNNIISVVLTIAIVFLAPLLIAYAGFLYVLNAADPNNISKAKSILWNVVKGIVIALAAWMIVDALMAVLYNGKFGAWADIVSSNGAALCLPQSGTSSGGLPGQAPAPTGSVATTGGNALSFGSGACDAAVLQQAAPSLTLAQANTFACLAKPESSCGSNLQNGYWNRVVPNTGGLASTAYGAFQVTLSSNHQAYENQACHTAADIPAGQQLNCQNGFGPNGFTAGGDAAVLTNCIKAASSLACSTAAAAYMLQRQGWSAWTADPRSTTQQACITQYSGG